MSKSVDSFYIHYSDKKRRKAGNKIRHHPVSTKHIQHCSSQNRKTISLKIYNSLKCIHNIYWPITTPLSGFRRDSVSSFQHQFDWLKCPVTLRSLLLLSSPSSLFRNFPLFLHQVLSFLCIFRTRIWIWIICCCNLCIHVCQYLEEVFIISLCPSFNTI